MNDAQTVVIVGAGFGGLHAAKKLASQERGVRVEQRTVRHGRAAEGQRDVEAVADATWNDVHVIVRLILSRGLAAADHDVHILAAGHLSDRAGQRHGDLEQVHAQLGRDLENGLIVLSRNHEHVTASRRPRTTVIQGATKKIAAMIA